MPERGGPTSQAGFFYQNTVAARYLADLVDLSPLPPRERVVEVRLEAPAQVDDIVVRFADGHREWIQAKLGLKPGDKAWRKLWTNLLAQSAEAGFGADDRLFIVIGTPDQVAMRLREICERAATAGDVTEWLGRLNAQMGHLVAGVQRGLGVSMEEVLDLLRRTSVEVAPQAELERTFERRRLGAAHALPRRLLSSLRDIAGGEARIRSLLLAPRLRSRLKEEFGIDIAEPAEWGVSAYRDTVDRIARIDIPGTGVSGPVTELFVWPRAREYDRTATSDFEDEEPRWDVPKELSLVDLQTFPSNELDRCIVVAGPGHGKSALLQAISARLARSAFVPVLVPLGTFSAASVTISEFLNGHVNSEFDIRVDWSRLAEQGLLVLLYDGLDEIPVNSRQSVLGKISTYSARYPKVPWLLTIRDPAVLSGPAEARMIELLPLENADIARFADTLRSRVPGLDAWEFTRRLNAYPDLGRFARIPLFLTLLMVSWRSGESLPLKRADLIESYLRTLFSPQQHKQLPVSGVPNFGSPPSSLRPLAEALAYARVQQQEIGASEREVKEAASRYSDEQGGSDVLLSALLACGILKRQSVIRLQFPYPIVQEYLAACYIVRELPDTVASRSQDAIQRPWAQVLQFALELHPAPSAIVRAILAREDDVFATALRLVSRCITNGAAVDVDIREEAASRLAKFWNHAPWRTRERVGRLIVDGFSSPLPESVRRVLGNRWLIHDGAGEIVNRAKDPALSLEVLGALLERGLTRFMPARPLQSALNDVADQALALIAERARRPGVTEDQLAGLEDFVGVLVSERLTQAGLETANRLAFDHSLPDGLRLAAFRLLPQPLDAEGWTLVQRALRSEQPGDWYDAMSTIAVTDSPETVIVSLVTDRGLDHKRRHDVVGSLPTLIPDESRRRAFIQRCVRDRLLPSPYDDLALAFAARYGDASAYTALVERLATVDHELATITVSLLGHYRSRTVGLRAAELVGVRNMDPEQVTAMARSAVLGATYIYEMDWLDGGGMKSCPPHPSIDVWSRMVEGWTERNDLSFIQRCNVLEASAELGSMQGIDRLEQAIRSVIDPDDPRYDEDDYGHTLRSAIDELRRRRRLLPLNVARRFVCARRPNLPYAGIAMIGAQADRSALDLLIELYNEVDDWHRKNDLMDALESLAGRLEVVVRLRDERLTAE